MGCAPLITIFVLLCSFHQYSLHYSLFIHSIHDSYDYVHYSAWLIPKEYTTNCGKPPKTESNANEAPQLKWPSRPGKILTRISRSNFPQATR